MKVKVYSNELFSWLRALMSYCPEGWSGVLFSKKWLDYQSNHPDSSGKWFRIQHADRDWYIKGGACLGQGGESHDVLPDGETIEATIDLRSEIEGAFVKLF